MQLLCWGPWLMKCNGHVMKSRPKNVIIHLQFATKKGFGPDPWTRPETRVLAWVGPVDPGPQFRGFLHSLIESWYQDYCLRICRSWNCWYWKAPAHNVIHELSWPLESNFWSKLGSGILLKRCAILCCNSMGEMWLFNTFFSALSLNVFPWMCATSLQQNQRETWPAMNLYPEYIDWIDSLEEDELQN